MVWDAWQKVGGSVKHRRMAHTCEAAGAGQSGGACRRRVSVRGLF